MLSTKNLVSFLIVFLFVSFWHCSVPKRVSFFSRCFDLFEQLPLYHCVSYTKNVLVVSKLYPTLQWCSSSLAWVRCCFETLEPKPALSSHGAIRVRSRSAVSYSAATHTSQELLRLRVVTDRAALGYIYLQQNCPKAMVLTRLLMLGLLLLDSIIT